MEFIWFFITLWQWCQTTQILFTVPEILCGPGTHKSPSCDVLTSAACQMGFQFGCDTDLENVSFSSAAWCQRHPALLWDPDCRWACSAWHGPSGDGALSRLAGSWKDEGLIKRRWVCYSGHIDRVQGRKFQVLDTNWKARFSFSIQIVLAPVCCY